MPGVDLALHQFAGVASGSFARNGFNFMVLHCLRLRSMTLAHPDIALMPWPAFKSFSPKVWYFLPETGPVHYYQEEILHAAVAGVNEYFFFNPVSAFAPVTPSLSAAVSYLFYLSVPIGNGPDLLVPLSDSLGLVLCRTDKRSLNFLLHGTAVEWFCVRHKSDDVRSTADV
jgi:hypothetical protein